MRENVARETTDERPGALQTALVPAWRLTLALIPLAAIAAGTGLIHPSVYRETDWVLPQNIGQDLVTLIALAAMVYVLAQARAGSARAIPLWIGLLGYLWYTYVGASFSYRFNELFLIYVACFSVSSAALIALFGRLDVTWLKSRFSERTPNRAAAIFLAVMSIILSLLWLGQTFAFLADGTLPDLIVRAATPTNFVFVLDLGVVVPLSLLAALLLWQDRAWGYALAGAVLVKVAAMGIALISMTAFAAHAGIAIDWGLASFWLAIAIGGSVMTMWFVSACRA